MVDLTIENSEEDKKVAYSHLPADYESNGVGAEQTFLDMSDQDLIDVNFVLRESLVTLDGDARDFLMVIIQEICVEADRRGVVLFGSRETSETLGKLMDTNLHLSRQYLEQLNQLAGKRATQQEFIRMGEAYAARVRAKKNWLGKN